MNSAVSTRRIATNKESLSHAAATPQRWCVRLAGFSEAQKCGFALEGDKRGGCVKFASYGTATSVTVQRDCIILQIGRASVNFRQILTRKTFFYQLHSSHQLWRAPWRRVSCKARRGQWMLGTTGLDTNYPPQTQKITFSGNCHFAATRRPHSTITTCECSLPSFFIPARKHFRRRQNRHWLRLSLSTVQLRLNLQRIKTSSFENTGIPLRDRSLSRSACYMFYQKP